VNERQLTLINSTPMNGFCHPIKKKGLATKETTVASFFFSKEDVGGE